MHSSLVPKNDPVTNFVLEMYEIVFFYKIDRLNVNCGIEHVLHTIHAMAVIAWRFFRGRGRARTAWGDGEGLLFFFKNGDGKKQLQNMDWEWMEEDKKEERRKETSKKLNDTSEVYGSTTAD